jgi:peptide/nickel transport system substrate-binding protein
MMHPDGKWALSQEELQQFPVSAKTTRPTSRKPDVIAEAGFPNGFKTVLTNRNIKIPYIDLAVYIISAWKKIGVEVEHKVEESATWSKSRVARDFELLLDPYGSATVGDPDEMLDKFITGASENWGRFSDPVVDKLYEQQSREMDEQKARTGAADRRIPEKTWRIQGLWTNRLEVRSARIHNYTPHPSHWMNCRFEDVWLEK